MRRLRPPRSAARPRSSQPRHAPAHDLRFREISVAYAVVSDPQKRAIYDRYGLQGMQMIEAAGVPPWVLSSPLTQGGVFCFVLVTFLTVLVCLPTFIVLRADGTIEWPWLVVFVPIWLVPPRLAPASSAPLLFAALRPLSTSSSLVPPCMRRLCFRRPPTSLLSPSPP